VVEIIEHCDAYSAASWRDVFIIHWSRTPTVEPVDRLTVAIRAFGAKQPGGAVVFVVIPSDCRIPDAAGRAALTRGMKENEAHARTYVMVHHGTGLVAAAIRAVNLGFQAVMRQQGHFRMFGSVDEAAAWLSGLGIESVARAAELVSAVAEAKALAARTG